MESVFIENWSDLKLYPCLFHGGFRRERFYDEGRQGVFFSLYTNTTLFGLFITHLIYYWLALSISFLLVVALFLGPSFATVMSLFSIFSFFPLFQALSLTWSFVISYLLLSSSSLLPHFTLSFLLGCLSTFSSLSFSHPSPTALCCLAV